MPAWDAPVACCLWICACCRFEYALLRITVYMHALIRMFCRCGYQLMLIEQFERDGLVDVLGAVCQLRQDRGFTVQTADQYVFIHKVG